MNVDAGQIYRISNNESEKVCIRAGPAFTNSCVSGNIS
jgi:hypothetical protein